MRIINKEVKKFIDGFDFEKPNFKNLPEDFPKISKKGLSREEGHLLDAIVIAWIVNESSNFARVHAYIKSNSYFEKAIDVNLKLAKAVFTFFLIAAFSISFISVTYYLNIEFGLGLTFLTEFFV